MCWHSDILKLNLGTGILRAESLTNLAKIAYTDAQRLQIPDAYADAQP